MAVRGAAAARRRQRRRAALWSFVGGFVVGGVLSAIGGGFPIGSIIVGLVLGGFGAAVAALVVSLLPTTSGGPRGQH